MSQSLLKNWINVIEILGEFENVAVIFSKQMVRFQTLIRMKLASERDCCCQNADLWQFLGEIGSLILCYRGCLMWLRQTNPIETDMSETRSLLLIETLEPEFGMIWVRHEAYGWHWYDWDTLTQTCTDMTETPKKILFSLFDSTQLWLRHAST